MFKTMDGVSVYDKTDVDGIVQPIEQNATEAKQIATTIDSRKLDKSEATREFAADRDRLAALENDKAAKSEVSEIVHQTVDATINAKLAEVESNINHIVDNAVDDALEDYDTSAQTAQKTATAIDTALQNYDDSSAVNQKIATAIGNILAGPTAMTTSEATALINNYF